MKIGLDNLLSHLHPLDKLPYHTIALFEYKPVNPKRLITVPKFRNDTVVRLGLKLEGRRKRNYTGLTQLKTEGRY